LRILGVKTSDNGDIGFLVREGTTFLSQEKPLEEGLESPLLKPGTEIIVTFKTKG
jgi:hypothetical protein